LAKEVFVETPIGAQPGYPHPPGRNRSAIGAAATCLIRGLVRGLRVKKRLVTPPACHSPGRLEFRKSRWRGHLRGRALNDS
jgi:hypothetical protein